VDEVSADSGFSVGSGDRVKGLSSEGSAPRTFQFGRKYVEPSGDVIEDVFTKSPNKCPAFTRRNLT